MKKVEVFETSDGEVFKKQSEAEEHERELALTPEIAAFRDSPLAPYSSGAHATMMDSIIRNWEKFKSSRILRAEAKPADVPVNEPKKK